jgi:ribulose-5-phosphate 4-epimerase/fuculose-1-phosphate aldolase
MVEDLIALKNISQHVGKNIAFIQGPGGNTSVKISERLMAIKASGFTLSQLTETNGFSIVKHQEIKTHLLSYNSVGEKEDEANVSQFITLHIHSDTPLAQTARPSMETGFHSLFKKFVVHSHSVYSNIINCTYEGIDLLQKIKSSIPLSIISVPYFTPGAAVTIAIRDALAVYSKQYGDLPQIVLLENHGMIVSANDADTCIEIHKTFNETVKEILHIRSLDQPSTLREVKGEILSENPWWNELLSTGYSFKNVFFPDQVIFLANKISYDRAIANKVNFDTPDSIRYRAPYREAQIMDELILSILFVYAEVKRLGLTPRYLAETAKNFLLTMESEKFRIQQLNQL